MGVAFCPHCFENNNASTRSNRRTNASSSRCVIASAKPNGTKLSRARAFGGRRL